MISIGCLRIQIALESGWKGWRSCVSRVTAYNLGAASLDEAGLALQEMEDRINDFKPKIN